MKTLLLDQGLPRSTKRFLQDAQLDSLHVGELGMAHAKDAEILVYANEHDYVVVTLDSDFHTLLADRKSTAPTVIRIRLEGLDGRGLAHLLQTVLACTTEDILRGSAISVTEKGIRVRHLPLL